METAKHDDPDSGADANPPQMWPHEPEGREGGAACPAPEEEHGQMIEEPGYGHGV